MTDTAFDNSAVDSYVAELNNRQSEVTRGMSIENLKREVPSKIILWLGYSLSVALIILVLGYAIQKAFSVTTENITTTNHSGNSGNHAASNYHAGEDTLVDVDSILRTASDFPEDVDLPPPNTVRNYYIFDVITLDNNPVKKVHIGRKYEDPNSEASSIFCYARRTADGVDVVVDLITIEANGKRTKHEISKGIATSYGVPLASIKEAQASCSI